MASPIGSSFSSLPPARPQPSDAARAAQRAFFSQALTTAQATPAAAPPPRAPAAQPMQAAQAMQAAATTPAPDRPLRPGSLLDIKV